MMRLSEMLLPLSLLAGLSSCSVKENRIDCPCFLELQVSGGELDRDVFSVWRPGLCELDTLRVDGGTASFEFEIPKGRAVLSVWSGQSRCERAGSVLSIPEGCEMDEIYAWSRDVDLKGETASVEASLHRQFAHLHLTVLFQDGEASPYMLRLRGNVAGMDLRDLMPVPGSFSVDFMPIFGTYHRICVPRQKDDALVLEFLEREAGTRSGDEPSGTFPIGECIREAGYDWEAEDLRDIYVEVDYALAGVSIHIEGWEEGEEYKIVI